MVNIAIIIIPVIIISLICTKEGRIIQIDCTIDVDDFYINNDSLFEIFFIHRRLTEEGEKFSSPYIVKEACR